MSKVKTNQLECHCRKGLVLFRINSGWVVSGQCSSIMQSRIAQIPFFVIIFGLKYQTRLGQWAFGPTHGTSSCLVKSPRGLSDTWRSKKLNMVGSLLRRHRNWFFLVDDLTWQTFSLRDVAPNFDFTSKWKEKSSLRPTGFTYRVEKGDTVTLAHHFNRRCMATDRLPLYLVENPLMAD